MYIYASPKKNQIPEYTAAHQKLSVSCLPQVFPEMKCSVYNVDPSGPFHILEFVLGKLIVYSLKVTV